MQAGLGVVGDLLHARVERPRQQNTAVAHHLPTAHLRAGRMGLAVACMHRQSRQSGRGRRFTIAMRWWAVRGKHTCMEAKGLLVVKRDCIGP